MQTIDNKKKYIVSGALISKFLKESSHETLRQVDLADIQLVTDEDLSIANNWVAYDFMNLDSRPPKYGKYFVRRKDGKVHWETWNGSGWAYNGNVITYWMEVKPPCS